MLCQLLLIWAWKSSVVFQDPALEATLVEANWSMTFSGPGVPIDTDGNGEISTTEALSVTGYVILNSNGITSLNGMQAFLLMRHLYIYENDLVDLVGLPPGLETLYVFGNRLTAVDLSSYSDLVRVELVNNRLDAFPVLPSAIQYVDVSVNSIDFIGTLQGYSQLDTLNISRNSVDAMPLLPSSIRVVDASHNSMVDVSNAVISPIGFGATDELDLSINMLDGSNCFNLAVLDLRFGQSGALLDRNPQLDHSLLEAELSQWPLPLNITVYVDRLTRDVYASPVCE